MAVEKAAKSTKFEGTKDAKQTRGASPGAGPRALDFGALVTATGQVHERCATQAGKAVSWFKRNAMTAGDNPPIGLLLCTRKDHSLVEYALADLPNRLFVSKYQLELPTRDQLQKFLDAQLKEVGDA